VSAQQTLALKSHHHRHRERRAVGRQDLGLDLLDAAFFVAAGEHPLAGLGQRRHRGRASPEVAPENQMQVRHNLREPRGHDRAADFAFAQDRPARAAGARALLPVGYKRGLVFGREVVELARHHLLDPAPDARYRIEGKRIFECDLHLPG
jgi:hypothetical protein